MSSDDWWGLRKPWPRPLTAARSAAVLGATFVTGAMRAAIDCAAHFDAMTHDLAIAVSTARRQCVDGAFEAVESHRAAALDDLEGPIVVIAALIALRHEDRLS